jgi:hypothetical protein
MKTLFDDDVVYRCARGTEYRAGENGFVMVKYLFQDEYQSLAKNSVLEKWLHIGFIRRVSDGVQ